MVSSQVMYIIGMNVPLTFMANIFYFLVFKLMQYVFQVNYLSIVIYFKTNIIDYIITLIDIRCI